MQENEFTQRLQPLFVKHYQTQHPKVRATIAEAKRKLPAQRQRVMVMNALTGKTIMLDQSDSSKGVVR